MWNWTWWSVQTKNSNSLNLRQDSSLQTVKLDFLLIFHLWIWKGHSKYHCSTIVQFPHHIGSRNSVLAFHRLWLIHYIGTGDYITVSFIRLNNTDCDKLKTEYTNEQKRHKYHFTKPEAKCSVSQVALLKMEVWQVFPPRPHTCGSHQQRDGQNVSNAVSLLIFMENYTFDLNTSQSAA